ncbi:MAG: 16S rRNA (cytidine(1402)-2'-O)-methyltransferase [Candidatus Berkelbacteria bacterium]|nr:MAG: 16S rRNA (cytidine(1402)-2'-O)-methyltransferase [Candidatus Berkelbacteria bacterium]QQG51570.1 MAG: 16S rRNA (cytidine(1402)-2'-O)-methyltransferase [Candidatus Berkelbacteria bacterium]
MLYIVSSPIGNLKDITFRAVETLQTVEKIYCEDTRRTKILLEHYHIVKPLESYHHHSDYKIPSIVKELKAGKNLAYLSDAGTPGIADPAGKLVAAARQAAVEVVPIPGASSVTAILSVAGIYANAYQFWGYVPTKKGRETFIKELLVAKLPVVFFETAPRLQKFFTQVKELGGGSQWFLVGRELTKQFEEIASGTPEELSTHFATPKGEFVIVKL